MAVEDGSSSNPGQQKNIVKPASEEVATPVRQSFVDKVRARMQSSEVSWMKLFDESKEDEEDEGHEATSEKKRSTRRFPRLRGILIPRPETIRDDPPKINVLTPYIAQRTENPSEDESQKLTSTHETEHEASIEPSISQSDEDIPAGEVQQRDPNELNALPQVEVIDQPRNQGDFVDINNVPAESVYTILQRRQQVDTSDGSLDVSPPREGGKADTLEKEPKSNVDSMARRASPVGALLAADVLNYAVARGRDAKNEAASVKRDKQIIGDQKHQATQFNSELNRQDAYQKELSRRIERSEKQQSTPLPKVRNAELRPRFTEIPKLNVEKNTPSIEFIESKNEQYEVVEKSVEVAERTFSPAPDILRPDVEAVLHTVEQAAEKNMPIEAQYELRHEHKGNDTFSSHDGQGADMRVSGGGQHAGYGSSLGYVATQAKSEQGSGNQDQPVYKQVASTGALGAVVGVLLFIVLYILTR
jgi:hypothetical protein